MIATNYLSELQRYGTAFVNITLRDINDEVPVFGQERYTATINEITVLGTVVFTVTASDGDMSNVSFTNTKIRKLINVITLTVDTKFRPDFLSRSCNKYSLLYQSKHWRVDCPEYTGL